MDELQRRHVVRRRFSLNAKGLCFKPLLRDCSVNLRIPRISSPSRNTPRSIARIRGGVYIGMPSKPFRRNVSFGCVATRSQHCVIERE